MQKNDLEPGLRVFPQHWWISLMMPQESLKVQRRTGVLGSGSQELEVLGLESCLCFSIALWRISFRFYFREKAAEDRKSTEGWWAAFLLLEAPPTTCASDAVASALTDAWHLFHWLTAGLWHMKSMRRWISSKVLSSQKKEGRGGRNNTAVSEAWENSPVHWTLKGSNTV